MSQAIKTTFLGPTDFHESRIKAACEAGAIMIPYPHELNGEACHQAAVKALCAKLGWHGRLVTGGLKDCYVHVFVDRKYPEGSGFTEDTFEV